MKSVCIFLMCFCIAITLHAQQVITKTIKQPGSSKSRKGQSKVPEHRSATASCVNTSSSLNIHSCNSYTLNNVEYDTTGVFQQIIPNQAGCDSVITLYLTLESYLTKTTDTTCDSYNWEGMTLTKTGAYSVRYVAIDGCDSLFLLFLTIKNGAAIKIDTTICSGQQYEGYSKPGVYTDTFAAAGGCDSVRTLNLSVRPPVFSSDSATICQGSSYAGYTQSGVYTDTFAVANGCDSISILHLTVTPLQVTARSVSLCEGVSYFAAGAYQTVSGIYDDTLHAVSGCDSIIRTTIAVHPKPLVDLGPDRHLCIGQPITFSPGSFATYLWQDGSTFNNFVAADTGIYWVTVTDSYHCQASDTIVIKDIVPPPAHFLPATDSICQYENLTITATGNYSTYLWSTGSTQANIVAAPGNYVLTVTDTNGCMGTDSISLIQKNCRTGIYLPAAFTPNNDRLNDVFRAKVFGQVIQFSLQVYNRFGGLVFATADPQQGWDGTLKGATIDTGSFVWICRYQLQGDKPVTQKGTVTLLR